MHLHPSLHRRHRLVVEVQADTLEDLHEHLQQVTGEIMAVPSLEDADRVRELEAVSSRLRLRVDRAQTGERYREQASRLFWRQKLVRESHRRTRRVQS